MKASGNTTSPSNSEFRSHGLGPRAIVGALFLVLLTLPVAGQAQEEPLFEKLKSTFQHEYFSVGILLQAVGNFQVERSFSGANGFSIANARLNLFGNLDGGFGYLFTANFVESPVLLDANVSYRVLPALAVSAGQFKTPFSAEFLTYAGSIDFVNRSQVVTALSPGRQIGVQLGGEIAKNELSYLVGVFNGNGISTNGNEGDNFLSVARVMINPIGIASQPQSGFLGLGVNAAHSKETDATLAGGLLRGFTGTRVLVGGDILFVSGPVYLSAEFIYSRFRSIDRSSRDPYGFHATAGYRVAERSQLLLRVDSFAADGLQEDSHLVIAGYNFWPTQVTELQINYIVPTIGAGFKNHQLLVNAQLGF